MPHKPQPLLPVVCGIALLGSCIGAWELVITRHASMLFFYDIAYLVLAICLLAIGAGAFMAARFTTSFSILTIVAIGLVSIPVAAISLYFSEAAWWLCLFAVPFMIFGYASTLAFNRANARQLTHQLYAVEIISVVIGITLIGPYLALPHAPLNVLGDIGITNHLRDTVQRESLVQHQWQTSPYARTDFVWTENQDVAYAFTDGMFVTRAVRWNGKDPEFSNPEVEQLATLKRLAMQAARRDRIALLGAGAGFDVAVALQEGAVEIDAVEINAATLAFARSQSDWTGAPFAHSAVNTHVAEARRFMEQTDAQYDHINLTLLQTSPASGRGRHHVDARVLTVEAIQTYAGKLKPTGTISIIQNSELLAQKTFTTLQKALAKQSGFVIHVIRLPPTETYNPFSYLLLATQSPDLATYKNNLQALINASVAEVYQPEPTAVTATDNQPFFFESNSPYFYQPVILVALTCLIFAILMTRGRKETAHRSTSASAFLIGAAIMCFQVLVLYRNQSALGYPVMSLSLSLAALIGGTTMGALLFSGNRQLSWVVSVVAAVAGMLLFTLFSGQLVAQVAGRDLETAAVITAAFTFVCSIPQGLPFLLLLQQSHQLTETLGHGEGIVIGYDGLGGIAGVSAGTLLAMLLGFYSLGWTACLLLLLALAAGNTQSSPVSTTHHRR